MTPVDAVRVNRTIENCTFHDLERGKLRLDLVKCNCHDLERGSCGSISPSVKATTWKV